MGHRSHLAPRDASPHAEREDYFYAGNRNTDWLLTIAQSSGNV